MSSLVAAPKTLFGRSLSAIPPSLFPKLVLGSAAILAFLLLYTRRKELMTSFKQSIDPVSLKRALMLFAVMIFYALAMKPMGFFLSSAISLAIVSLIAGNRVIWQVCLVSLICPVALYLLATRGLAVALPELSSIEFFYASILDGSASPVEAVGAEPITEQSQ